MIQHRDIDKKTLITEIKRGEIVLGGNLLLKIYGKLDCKSGKRMKVENRVFFASELEAIQEGFRPCGICLRTKYNEWKKSQDK